MMMRDGWRIGAGGVTALVLLVALALGGVQPVEGHIPCRVGDFVWHDLNHNGLQDPGEPGINGVTITIRGADNKVIATRVTGPHPIGGAPGYWEYAEGCWPVTIEVTPPAGMTPTTPGVGSDRGIDSNPSPTAVILSDTNPEDLTVDFGFVTPCTGSIGDFVWADLNRNGVQDAGEPGLDGVTVRLRAASGAVIATTVTGPSGFYAFTGLCRGDYTVEVNAATLPAGLVPTASLAGGDTQLDSNGSPAVVSLPSDAGVDTTIDFGYVPACAGVIGDFVWQDLNHDGVQDAGEPGIDGVTVRLRDAAGTVLATTITGPDGFYQFAGVCAGDYQVEVDAATVPAGLTATATGAGDTAHDSNPSPSPVSLPAADSEDVTIDFGFVAPCAGSIGDFVWEDLDHDGRQDAGEPGIPGVVVNLRRASDNALLATTTTNASGFYQFTGLCAGDYRVEVIPPAGFVPTPTGIGDAAGDSNVNPSTVTLPADNASDDTVDFGFQRETLMCELTDTSGTTSPVGILSWFVDASGDVFVRYDQSRSVNDNSYGHTIVQWPRNRNFSDLVGSDQARFVFRDRNGTVALDFRLDYISGTSGTPSGYASRGATGGDGRMNVGNAAWILAWQTSLADNLNNHGLCTAGNCTVAGVNLLADSPPADTNYNVLNSVFGAWDFTNSYWVRVSHLAFGATGFGSVAVPEVHNSPSKTGTNLTQPVPCVPDGGGQVSFCVGKTKPKALTFVYTGDSCSATHHSQDPTKVSCSGDPAHAAPVRIVASSRLNLADPHTRVWFDGVVALDGSFTIDAASAGARRLGADTYFQIFDPSGRLLQTLKVHTSCSQPLDAGDQFGSLRLTGFTPATR
jgi:hypothetical protein